VRVQHVLARPGRHRGEGDSSKWPVRHNDQSCDIWAQNVEWVERETIRRALEVSPLKQQAARLMGISPRALSHYLAKYPFIAEGASPSRQS